ncbi:hypothetical protein ASE19_05325 [Nocardioides sp. Root79]|nr:hypothetical protein ASE19_05325 [Nocardioides sp. Root79]KRC73778.1 hypothetical protein ASE20_03895 [Nocardioides sp. Root240]
MHDLDALYAASYRRLVVQMYALCGDLADAEDAVQEAFITALRKRRTLQSVLNPEAWIRTVALRRLHGGWRHRAVVRHHQALDRGPAPVAEIGPEHVALVSALAQLDVGQREVVVLHHLADRTVDEIATTSGSRPAPSSPGWAGDASGSPSCWPTRSRPPRGRNRAMADWDGLRELAHDVTPPDFASLEHTARRRQHRARGLVGALAAVVLVAGGIGIATHGDGRDDSQPVKEPTRSPSDLPEGVHALPAAPAGEDFVDVPAGRYRIDLGEDISYDVDLPDGSSAHDDGLFLSSAAVVLKVELAGDDYGVPRDPCAGGIVPVGPGVDALVAAMAALPVFEVSAPEPVRLGGASGYYLEADVPRAYDASRCSGDGAVQLPGRTATVVGAPPPYHGRWWVLDVGGHRVVVQQNCWDCTRATLQRAANDPRSVTFTSTR